MVCEKQKLAGITVLKHTALDRTVGPPAKLIPRSRIIKGRCIRVRRMLLVPNPAGLTGPAASLSGSPTPYGKTGDESP
ncbi:MAG: hypothetical protein OXE85_10680 [Roseovarius sp.]|nr:hypothetical protein [Roseovarius sp.]